MRLRATLRIRNDEMIAARERLGLNQKEAAEQAGVPMYFLYSCEKLDYIAAKYNCQENVLRIASFLGLDPEVIMPEELQGVSIQSCFTATANVENKVLREGIQQQFRARNLLPAPDEECEQNDLIEMIQQLLPTLSYREREIMKLLYGLDDNDKTEYSYSEVGRIFKVTRERVRQVEARAILKMKVLIAKKS